MYIIRLAQMTGALLGVFSIPFGMVLLCELVIGVAFGWRGQIPAEIRHRDDPKAFWKRIRGQIAEAVIFCLVLALLFTRMD